LFFTVVAKFFNMFFDSRSGDIIDYVHFIEGVILSRSLVDD